jgi:hypothetical protein
MKNLTDSELLALAHKNLAIADKHLYSTIILLVLAIAQAIFLFINLITITPYLIITILSYILYFYHRKKQEKYMKIVDEVLEELTSREV